jgi:26S proteasome regulatory subunit N1
LKDNLGIWVENIKSDDLTIKEEAVSKIFFEVISATSSMTSIPKPMKFLVAHYPTLVEEYEKTQQSKTKVLLNELAIFLRFTGAFVRYPSRAL